MTSRRITAVNLVVALILAGCAIVFGFFEQWPLAFASLVLFIAALGALLFLQVRRTNSVAQKTLLRLTEVSSALAAPHPDTKSQDSDGVSLELAKALESLRWDISGDTEALVQLFQDTDPAALMPHTGRWAMDAKSLSQLLDLVRQHKPQSVLELGSGTSTIWLGYTLREWGGKLTTVDAKDEFLALTQRQIEKHSLSQTVSAVLAPLTPGTWDSRTKVWYDRNFIAAIGHIDFLLVDGPPGGTNRPDSRFPAVPELFHKIRPGGLVVLDDSQRPDEQAALKKWISDFDLEVLPLRLPRLTVLRKTSKPNDD